MVTEIQQARSHGENRSIHILPAKIFRFGLRRKKEKDTCSLRIYLFQYEIKTIIMILSTGNELYNDSAVVYTRCCSRN